MATQIAGIDVPTSIIAIAAAAQLQSVAPTFIVSHSKRCFFFSALLAKHRGVEINLDLLYVAAMYHAVGLVDAYRDSTARYEIDGADAARDLLDKFEVSKEDIDLVWDAIALHTTPGIPPRKASLIELTSAGIDADLLGSYLYEISKPTVTRVLVEFPREKDFSFLYLEYLGAGQYRRAATTFGTVNADVVERFDEKYRRLNYCGKVLGSLWESGLMDID